MAKHWFLKALVVYIFSLGVLAGLCYWGVKSFRNIETGQVPVRTEIERAIGVKGLENKFIAIHTGLFSSAGAGGLGAPQIFTVSAEQLVELVDPGEPVYVSMSYGTTDGGTRDDKSVKKVYWAFKENRPMVFVYEDVYTYEDLPVEKFDDTTVYFKYDNIVELAVAFVFLGIFGAIMFFFLEAVVIERTYYPD